MAEDWWPWAVAGGGGVLALIALVWLVRHLPRRTGSRVTLDDSGAGRLTLDLGAATAAAAETVAETTPGVRFASGRQVVDRGQLVAELVIEIEPTADLAVVRAVARDAAGRLAATVGVERLRHRTRLRVARPPRTPARVS